jgi:hypothetical protein
MNIYEIMKSEEFDLRLTNDSKYRWLVWNNGDSQWKVYQKAPRQRSTRCLYSGDSADEALLALTIRE